MKVYAVRGNYKKFAGLLYKDSLVQEQFYQRTPGKSLLSEWENIEVKKGVKLNLTPLYFCLMANYFSLLTILISNNSELLL